jgi:uncharacterized phage protein (TIGR01671 family)
MHDWGEMVDKNKIHLLNNENKSYVCEQFTGLKDRNGVEIYEGDLYRTTVLAGHPTNRWGGEYWVNVTAKVKFVNGRFVGVVVGHIKSSYEPEYKKGHFDGRIAEIKDIEIIGNIHQNPELLK